MNDDFYMILPSNTKTGKGSISNYHVNLPHTVDLEGQWSVALMELMYPCTYHTLYNATFDFNCSVYTVEWRNGNHPHYKTDTVRSTVRIPNSHYSSVEQIVTAVKMAFDACWKRKAAKVQKTLGEKLGVDPDANTMYNQYLAGPNYFTIKYDAVANRVLVEVENPMHDIVLSKDLAYSLGFKEERMGEGRHIAPFPPDPKGGLSCFYIYLPLIEPIIVGDTATCLLKIVPVGNGKYGDQSVIEIAHPQYIPVCVRRFSSVEVSINTPSGEPVPFAFGTVYLKLHFMRKSVM